jgi:hypothetical protein
MPCERRHLDGHEGKQRQRAEDGVQLVMVGHVEDADLRVGAGDAPQMAPGAVALQRLGAGLLGCLQLVELRRRQVARRVDVHADVVAHRGLPHARA